MCHGRLDGERGKKPQERRRLAGGDSVEQVLRRFVSKAVQGQQLFLCQVIEVCRVRDQLAIDQLLKGRVPQALDVE